MNVMKKDYNLLKKRDISPLEIKFKKKENKIKYMSDVVQQQVFFTIYTIAIVRNIKNN